MAHLTHGAAKHSSCIVELHAYKNHWHIHIDTKAKTNDMEWSHKKLLHAVDAHDCVRFGLLHLP